MRLRGQYDLPRVLSLLVCVAAAVAAFHLCLHALYSGFMTFDAAYQYWQLRSGYITTQHPPSMIWL
jgi:hypothetical protein